ncbi:ribonuclease H-like domain-containing protein [Tanacetum coccineum]
MVGPSNSEDLISSLDLGNPLHLQNSDFSSNTIISVKLTGTEKYRVWAAMKLTIKERNLIEALPLPLLVVSKPQVSGFVSKSNNWTNNRNKKVDNKKYGNTVNAGNNRGTNPNLLCKNCGNVGHTIDRCFDLIGYPPGYNKNPDPKQNGFKSFNANSASTSNENGTSLSFTNEHMIKLMNLINEVPYGNMQANMAGRASFFNSNIIDSEANQHMTISTVNMFGIIDISDLNLTMGHPNGTLAKIKYVSNLRLSEKVVLFDVLVVPEYCDLHQNKIMGTGSENGGLYLFDTPSSFSSNCQTLGNQSVVCYVSKSLWHNRLDHPSDQAIDVLLHDLNFTKDSQVSPCDICHKAKQTRGPFSFSDHQTTVIELSGSTLSDNDTEFVNNKMHNLFNNLGIVHQTTCAYTPQQNDIAKRKHLHLLNVARSLLFQNGIPLNMWTKCILTAVYLINRLSSSVLLSPTDDERGPVIPNDDGNDHPCTRSSNTSDDSEDDFCNTPKICGSGMVTRGVTS